MSNEPRYTPTPATRTIFKKTIPANPEKGVQFPKGTNMKPPVPPQNRPY